MHCSGCGLIIGKDAPPDLCRCPRCGRILFVLAFLEKDGFDGTRFVPVEGTSRRTVSLYVNQAMLRFLLASRTRRPSAWEPLLFELEEERLKAFALERGWAVSGVHRDPGPQVPDSERPFARLQSDLKGGKSGAILVTDFDRVPRRDLRGLADIARESGADLLSIAPHPFSPNLERLEIDFESIEDDEGDSAAVSRLWTEPSRAALRKLWDASGWHFVHYLPEVLAHTLGVEAVRAFRVADPRCATAPWREVLTRSLVARARRSGELDHLPPPRLLTCAQCRRRYLESALPRRLMELTVGRGAYCRICLRRAFFLSPEKEDWAAGPAPVDAPADVDAVREALQALPRERLHALIGAVLERADQAEKRIPASCPSNLWLSALSSLSLLPHLGEVIPSESLARARDGHLSAVLGVALLDNWLTERGHPHRLDVRYPLEPELNPERTLRADLGVQGALVEFLGMRGGDEFGKQIELRFEVCRRQGVALLAVYAEDLLVPAVLERKLKWPGAAAEAAAEGGKR